MLSVHLITVGKLKEKFYIEATQEYIKRLGGYCKFTGVDIPEEKKATSQAEVDKALDKEGKKILEKIPANAFVVVLCVEGKTQDSHQIAQMISSVMDGPDRHFVCIIGGSYGLSPLVKQRGNLKLSMSPMTFPHHLARVMWLEQLYRGFKINEGSSYHK